MAQIRPRAFQALHHRDFRALWAGMLLTNSAMVFDFYSQPWYVREVSESNANLMLGVLGLGRGTAMLLAAVCSGVLADRLDRRLLLLASQGLAILVKVPLAVLIISGREELWQVLPLMFAVMAFQAVDAPVRQALAPSILPQQQVPNAMALMVAALWGPIAVLPIVVGALIDQVGIGQTVAVSLIGHGAGVWALLALRYRGKPGPGQSGSLFRDARAGLRYAVQRPVILWVLLVTLLTGALGTPLTTSLAPSWMRDVLGVSATGYTLLAVVWGIGAAAVSLLLSSMSDVPKKGQLFVLSSLGFSASLILYGLSRSLLLTAMSWLINGALSSATSTAALTIVQRSTTDTYRGRTMALLNLSRPLNFMAALPLGALADQIGITVMVPALAILSTFLVMMMAALVPVLRHLDRAAAEESSRVRESPIRASSERSL